MEFLIGGLAGVGAAVITNPLDVVKTRFQLQGELRARGQHAVYYRSIPHAFYVIPKTEGLRALQKGLMPALVFQVCTNSTRLGLYQIAECNGLDRGADGRVSIPRAMACSAVCGVVGGVLGSPAYLIKTQVQSSSHASIAVGQIRHGHTGAWNACKNIYASKGLRGFVQGVNGCVPRLASGSMLQLTTFSSAKDRLRTQAIFCESPILLAAVASALSAVVVVAGSLPFDVVATRLYNQGLDPQGRGSLYAGVVDCFRKTVAKEGVAGLYKGLGPAYMRLAPHTVLSLVFWDKLKLLIQR